MSDPWGSCPRCGMQRRLRTFKTEWNGMRVCEECFDPRHPQERVKGVPDRQFVNDPRPDPEPIELSIDGDRASLL